MKKNWLLVPKMTWGIWFILMQTVASLKICTLMCYFCRKYIMFEPKRYKGDMCHNTKEWWKIWRGADLCFEKWHEEFGEFWLNTGKSQNLHFNGIFLTKVHNLWAKKDRGVIHHYAEGRWKLRRKNDLRFHKWHEKFGELH